MQPGAASFDGQAGGFDERAGLPEPACAAIAAAVASLGEMRPGDTILECGAGTGQIGIWLAQLDAAYIGFDLSSAMLGAFRRRAEASAARVTLVEADGDGRWPAGDGRVRVVFGARAFHQMGTEHTVGEAYRVAAAEGATLIVGRVQRDREGVASAMRRSLRQVMRARGLEPRRGDQHAGHLLDACAARGGTRLDDRSVASWPAAASPARSLRAWRGKEGLGGLHPTPKEKASILDEVEAWAESALGPLESEQASEDRFVLQAVRIRADIQ